MNELKDRFYLRIVFAFFYFAFIILVAFWGSLELPKNMGFLVLLFIFGLLYLVALIYLFHSYKKKQIQRKLDREQAEEEFFQKYYQKKKVTKK